MIKGSVEGLKKERDALAAEVQAEEREREETVSSCFSWGGGGVADGGECRRSDWNYLRSWRSSGGSWGSLRPRTRSTSRAIRGCSRPKVRRSPLSSEPGELLVNPFLSRTELLVKKLEKVALNWTGTSVPPRSLLTD